MAELTYEDGVRAAAKIAEDRHKHWDKLGNACLVDDDLSACKDISRAILALIGGAQ